MAVSDVLWAMPLLLVVLWLLIGEVGPNRGHPSCRFASCPIIVITVTVVHASLLCRSLVPCRSGSVSTKREPRHEAALLARAELCGQALGVALPCHSLESDGCSNCFLPHPLAQEVHASPGALSPKVLLNRDSGRAPPFRYALALFDDALCLLL